jgi:hypothetical protein
MAISRESTPYRLVGIVGTWVIILSMGISGVYLSLPL